MPFVSGFLHVREPGSPDNSLPGVGGPVDPGYGIGQGGSIDNSLPMPPPGTWPPPSPAHPIVPAPPGTPPGAIWPSPGRPSQGLPVQPGHPAHPLPPGGSVDNELPQPPPQAGNELPSKVYWMIAYCPALGWSFVAVDPSLHPGNRPPVSPGHPDAGMPPGRPDRPSNELPNAPVRPGNAHPPTPEPKR